MSKELFERGDNGYTRQRQDAKNLNKIQKQIDKIWRILQRGDSQTAVPTTLIVDETATTQTNHSLLAGLEADDHLQYLKVDGTRVMSGDIDLDNNDINNINISRFGITPTNDTPAEGDIWWNASEKTINVFDGQGSIQVGFESGIRGYNDTGSLINNGDIVYISGATGGRGNIVLAKADTHESSIGTLGMVTEEGGIADGVEGRVTTFGVVNDIDTSGMSAGDQVYLSDSTAGGYVNSRPVHPSFTIQVGVVMTVDASTGSILFDVDVRDNDNVLNGTTLENFDALVSSNGTVITMSLERSGGGDITARFAEGYSTIDCTPALTIALTAGTTSGPQMNFIYIPESTKVLTKSLSGYPTDEVYIEIGRFYVQSATDVQSDGALINQNINNYTASVTSQMGRVALLSQRLRKERAQWDNGIDANGATSSYFTIGAGTVDWLSTAGAVWQMHLQTIPAINMSTGNHAHVINDFTTPFNNISDLFEITDDATGTTINNNRYFSLVFWMAGNKGGEYSPLMVNLPNGFYTLQSAALVDADNYSVFEIPREFAIDTSTGFLVARATFQMGSTWDLIEVEDLRGKSPSTAGGGATSTVQTEFNDSTFAIFDLDDITRMLKYDAGGITTGNTRTWTIQDKSITVAGLDDITADIATHAAISDAHHSKTVSNEIDHDATTNFVSGEHFLQSAISITESQISDLGSYVSLSGNETIAGIKTFSDSPIVVDDIKFAGGSGVHRIYNADAGQVISHQHFDGVSSDVEVFRTSENQIISFLNHNFSDGVDVTGNITVTGTVDTVDIASFKTAYDAHIGGNIHIDWTGTSAGTIHATNYVDNDTTYVSSDFTHDDLTGFVANEHIDWSITGGTQIHADRYTDNDTTYVSSDFTHNDLTGLNDGAVYNHMTDAQITALHSIFVPAAVTAHTDITNAGSGIIISDAERTALHAEVTSLPIGSITGFTDNSTNWDTAYGWGDHDGLYELDGSIATHTAIAAAHHAKYLDSEALTAMGAKSDGNSYNHDRTVNTWRGIDTSPVNGQNAESITSNWAYDHDADASAHHSRFTTAEVEAYYGVSGSDMGDLLMYGSVNYAWIPCILEGDALSNTSYNAWSGYIRNESAADMNLAFKLPLPSRLGTKVLHVKGLRINQVLADSNDYITLTRVYATDYNSQTQRYYDSDNLTLSSKLYEDGSSPLATLTDFSVGEYEVVVVQLACSNTSFENQKIAGVFLQCYYT